MSVRFLLPDLLYRDGAFRRGLAVGVDEASGRITAVVAEAELEGHDAVVRLAGRALLPGMVNAHSHAFQRLIRGRTQWRPAAEPGADFWSWRESMYGAALSLSPEDIEAVSRFCFLEMLHAGYTAVGEFHYLHRDPTGRPYADPGELARRVIAGALDAGIRIALLNVCYATGGIGEPLRPEQRRFATPDPTNYVKATGELDDAFRDAPLVTVGVAPHSVRAVPREWLPELRSWAAERGAPFHMHVSEQPAEVDATLAAYGLRPIELLDEDGLLDAGLTAVHATHLTPAEVALLGRAGAAVCACPTTERDLGDGFLPGADLTRAGAAIALGSDSHTIIDPFEEMRLVEYHERLRRLRRVVLARPVRGDEAAAAEGSGESRRAKAGGDASDGWSAAERLEVAPVLLEMGTLAGARSLRFEAGAIEAGRSADLVAIDLDHRALAGWTPRSLAALLALSAPAGIVSDVWVDGRRRIRAGVHDLDAPATSAFREVAARIR